MNREEFLKSTEGEAWFRGKTKDMSRSSRAQFKRWLLYPKPSKMALKRINWNKYIDAAIKESQEKNG